MYFCNDTHGGLRYETYPQARGTGLVMSVKATVLKEIGQAVGFSAGTLGYVPGAQNVAGNTTDSSIYRTVSEHILHHLNRVDVCDRIPGRLSWISSGVSFSGVSTSSAKN